MHMLELLVRINKMHNKPYKPSKWWQSCICVSCLAITVVLVATPVLSLFIHVQCRSWYVLGIFMVEGWFSELEEVSMNINHTQPISV